MRVDRKLTQEQLGLAIGVARNTVSRIELGLNAPTADLIIMIAAQFGVHERELFPD